MGAKIGKIIFITLLCTSLFIVVAFGFENINIISLAVGLLLIAIGTAIKLNDNENNKLVVLEASFYILLFIVSIFIHAILKK